MDIDLPVLHDPVFLRYAILGVGLLIVAGILLSVLRFVFHKPLPSVWITYRSWWLMAVPILLALLGGRFTTIVGVILLAFFGFKEFARATGLYGDWWMTGAVYAGLFGVAASILVIDPRLDRPGWYGLFVALPAYAVGTILIIPILRNRARGQLQAVCLSLLGFIYLGWMFLHLGFLANAPHAVGYILFLLFAVEISDVAAFLGGKLFGRHQLRSEISPNKTWEGSLTAFAVAMILPWLLRFSFPHFGLPELILTGLIVGIGGQLGDLTISMIKRDLGVKDMGATIPGHGGILDRIDSLIFTAPLFFHMVRWFHGIY